MKSVCMFLSTGLVLLLFGCSSTPVALAPVGPNPMGIGKTSSEGELEVYSRLAEESDDQNQASEDPVWYQHTDYSIYNLQGKLVERVDNTIGHYEEAPRRVALPAGRYLVRAQANDYLLVSVPVTIERGRTTRVHLDDNWRPRPGAPRKELTTLPNGTPAGWRSASIGAMGIN